MDDPVPVPLVFRAKIIGSDRGVAPGAFGGMGCPGRKDLVFLLLQPFPYAHRNPSLRDQTCYRKDTMYIYNVRRENPSGR